ncbi:MAG TPA: SDR family oxidoreductase [Mycobacteriales bacterium]|jgi:NAD(P)-dependent dehydrogenase (short-subunit alcohol dehydrogenase family)|nr:SDR family oxidoreductase [Mycobacteriales bacterium]
MSGTPGVAVVTGAGSGIGRGVAVAMLRAGYRVVLAGRRAEPLAQTAATGGGESLCVPTDVSSEDAVRALFEAVAERWGRVDVLFNNAGMGGTAGAVDEITPEQWRQVVDVNLTGSFLCAHHAFALMRSQQPGGGRIINNGSISAHAPRPRSVGYTATKHAITGLTKSISLDGRPYGIACGQIDIGNAGTEMTARMERGVPQPDGRTMVEPTFDVQHVAEAVLYMAGLPLSANVQFMTIMATTMPLIGRG